MKAMPLYVDGCRHVRFLGLLRLSAMPWQQDTLICRCKKLPTWTCTAIASEASGAYSYDLLL